MTPVEKRTSKRILYTYVTAGVIALLFAIYGVVQKAEAEKLRGETEKLQILAEKWNRELEVQKSECDNLRLRLTVMRTKLENMELRSSQK